MVDAWGGWSLFQEMLRTLKKISMKHGVSIPAVAVKYVLNQVNSVFKLNFDFRSDPHQVNHLEESTNELVLASIHSV